MKWLVFSKDRPYQLDAFIRSAKENAGIESTDISVLHRYSSQNRDCLKTLADEHPGVTFIEEGNFRGDVIDWLESQSAKIVSFATDDAVFTRRVPAHNIEAVLTENPQVVTFSLRMGLHLDYCYPTNSPQRLPDGQMNGGFFVWNSNNAEGDWSYPLSVDGHVFLRENVLHMFKAFDFRNPNTLEANWQVLRAHVSPIACCLPKSCYFNVPLNRVQEDFKNRSGSTSHEELVVAYRDGKRYDTSLSSLFMNTSAHQEVDIT